MSTITAPCCDADITDCRDVPTCEHEWRLVENGYSRTWRIDIADDGTITAHYSGTSDFSEDGDGNLWLECSLCLDTEPLDGEVRWA